MATKEETHPHQSEREPQESPLCPKCKGAGVIVTADINQRQVTCCDRCSAGDRIWARLLDLLSDIDIPAYVPPRRGTTDTMIRR